MISGCPWIPRQGATQNPRAKNCALFEGFIPFLYLNKSRNSLPVTSSAFPRHLVPLSAFPRLPVSLSVLCHRSEPMAPSRRAEGAFRLPSRSSASLYSHRPTKYPSYSFNPLHPRSSCIKAGSCWFMALVFTAIQKGGLYFLFF